MIQHVMLSEPVMQISALASKTITHHATRQGTALELGDDACHGCSPFLPENCFVYPLGQLAELAGPKFQPIDCFLIDESDGEPEDGAVFLVRFGGDEEHLRIAQAKLIKMEGGRRWWLIPAGTSLGGRPFADGPYADDGELGWYVRSLIVGRVVGILRGDAGQSAPNPPTPRAERQGPLRHTAL
jgi:hypothetical protein